MVYFRLNRIVHDVEPDHCRIVTVHDLVLGFTFCNVSELFYYGTFLHVSLHEFSLTWCAYTNMSSREYENIVLIEARAPLLLEDLRESVSRLSNVCHCVRDAVHSAIATCLSVRLSITIQCVKT